MRKYGFTLAEVLITLGIIGVVAALTAPSLVISSRNQANAARLSTVVSNLENAFTNAIVQENADNIFRTRMWQAATDTAFVGELGQYLVVSSHGDDAEDFYSTDPTQLGKNGEKTNLSIVDAEIKPRYRISLKNGATIFMHRGNIGTMATDKQIETIRNNGGGLIANAGWIVVDVNGTAAPNTVGRDIFMFMIGQNGMLYPRGGTDLRAYQNAVGEKGGVWNEEGVNNCQVGSIASWGFGCTARVIAEGYEINY